MCEDTNNEDIGILNKTLQELIKLIRFYQIDRKEFIHVIWDHKHLLSEQLFKDLIHCLIDPDAKPLYNPFLIRWGNFKIDSELVNREIALILTNWINKKTTNNKASKGFQYNFNLLFRSSLDGLSSQTFHRKCDNKGATIVIAKAQKSDLLIGGYNPLDWNGENVYKSTTNSFIFVINLKDLKNLTVSRVNKNHSNSTIGCDNSHGPSFGEGPDLHVLDGCRIWKYQAKSYPKILNVDSFAISFYEVFQIVNNITK
ncbi:17592_t:CDS:1 [Gigaspora rosea]|nr:17592_t:CDS:1 [Gigaspora rosea]